MQKYTDIESSTSNNDEIMDDNNTSEEIYSHKNREEVIYHTCDDNGNNLLNIEEKADVTNIHSINATNNISMNNDEHCIHRYYAPFLSSKNHEYVFSGSEYDFRKTKSLS